MTDPRERIEIRMAEMQNTDGAYCEPCERHVDCAACQHFIDVITDVLDRHTPRTVAWSGRTVCDECGQNDVPGRYPCGPVKTIAEALGVLDNDD